VESFHIWGGTGQPEKLSNNEMERIFGTSNIDDAIKIVLRDGKMEGKDFEVHVPERGDF